MTIVLNLISSQIEICLLLSPQYTNMAELEIPEGSVADKNRGTKIIMDEEKDIGKDTTILFGNLDNIELSVDGFYEVRSDKIDTWIHLYASDSSDTGISGLDMNWRELVERVKYGEAEIVEE